MSDVVTLKPKISRLGNDERLEWVLACLHDQPPAVAKRLLVQAGLGKEPILTQQQVNVALGALGLEAA